MEESIIPQCEAVTKEAQKGKGIELVLPKTRYSAFLEEMKRSWVCEGRKELRETDTDFIHTFHVKKGDIGKVMELSCPESKAVSICGQSQANGADAYFFSLRCTGSDGREPNPSTKMNFKVRIENGDSPLWKVSYSSLKRCQLREGIFLENGDRLLIEIIDSDIDIEKVEVSIEADILGHCPPWGAGVADAPY